MASMRALTRSNSALVAISGTMTSGTHRLAGLARRLDRGLEDRARLHLGDFRIGDGEAAAAEAEHRIELVQFAARGRRASSDRRPSPARPPLISSSPCGKNSCSGGSSRRIVTGRPRMISNSSTKSRALHRQELGERRCAASSRRRRGSSRARPGCGLRRRTCARCGTGRCLRRRSARAACASVGVSALARTPSLRTLSAQPISVANSPESCGSIMSTLPASTWPVEPSTVMIVALLEASGRRRVIVAAL